MPSYSGRFWSLLLPPSQSQPPLLVYHHPQPSSLQSFPKFSVAGGEAPGVLRLLFRLPSYPHLFNPSPGGSRCLQFQNCIGTASTHTLVLLANEFWLCLLYGSASEILLVPFLCCSLQPVLLLLLAYGFKKIFWRGAPRWCSLLSI